MLNAAGGDTSKARSKFCGRKAHAYNPKTGKSVTMTLLDGALPSVRWIGAHVQAAFDDQYVRTPNSLDLTRAAVCFPRGAECSLTAGSSRR
jgi:hypothetical protein